MNNKEANLKTFKFNKVKTVKSCILNKQNCKISELEANITKDLIDLVDKNNSRNYFLMYFYHKVKLFTFYLDEIRKKKKLHEVLMPNYLLEARFFNKNKEIHIWRIDNRFYWRYRQDQSVEENIEKDDLQWKDQNVYEEFHYIQGKRVKKENIEGLDAYYLSNKKGAQIEINFLDLITNSNLPLKYQIHNYFLYNKLGLIKFFDARLCNIFDQNGEEI